MYCLEYNDDHAKNQTNFGILEFENWVFLWLKLNSGQHLKPNFTYHFSNSRNSIAYKSPMASRITDNLFHEISGVNFLLIHEQMDRF